MTRTFASARRTAAADAAKDASLIHAAASGDRHAFSELYQRHLDAVFALLTRLIGPVPERDDLIQQIFLDVHRALLRFRGDAAFSTFLHRIVVNVACEHLEQRRRARGRREPLEDRQLDALVAPGASPEDRVHHRGQLARVFTLLEELSPKRRAAFVLVAIERLPLEEAAALLDINAAAVKQRVLEARRELSRTLERAPKEKPR